MKRDLGENFGEKIIQRIQEQNTAKEVLSHELSLKDSLAAVCNATQAAARIHQVFRVQSFQRKQKQQKEYGDYKFGVSDERALSLITINAKSHKFGQCYEPVHIAATRIQNKFRSWKGRKDFLIIRRRIVKIQVHLFPTFACNNVQMMLALFLFVYNVCYVTACFICYYFQI